jgi:hypothetical protein
MRWQNAVPNLNAEIGRISSCHVKNALLAPTMRFDKRKMEHQRQHLAQKEAKARSSLVASFDVRCFGRLLSAAIIGARRFTDGQYDSP